jgi:hypothetical protein
VNHPAPAVTNVAPSISISVVTEPAPAIPLELFIGKRVALAASALAAGVTDYTNGGMMTATTKQRVGTLFAELVELRRLMIPFWDFDAICHQYGRLMLAEACGGVAPGEQRIIDDLINTAVRIMRKTTALELH